MRGVERNKRTVYIPRIGLAFTTLEFIAPWAMDLYLCRKSGRPSGVIGMEK